MGEAIFAQACCASSLKPALAKTYFRFGKSTGGQTLGSDPTIEVFDSVCLTLFFLILTFLFTLLYLQASNMMPRVVFFTFSLTWSSSLLMQRALLMSLLLTMDKEH